MAETGARRGLRPLVRRRRRRRASSTSRTSVVREYLVTMSRPDPRTTGRPISRTPGATVLRFIIQTDGRSPTSSSSNRAAMRPSISIATRALLLTQLPPLPAAYPEPGADRPPQFRVSHADDYMTHVRSIAVVVAFVALVVAAQRPDAGAGRPPPQQPGDVDAGKITGDPGTPPRLAVPDFLARCRRRGTPGHRAGRLAQVLWDDLEVRARVLHDPARHLQSIPAARRSEVPFDRWRELGADGVVHRHRRAQRSQRPRRDAALQRPRPQASPRARVHRLGREPAALRAHDGRRDPPVAAPAARRRAHAS